MVRTGILIAFLGVIIPGCKAPELGTRSSAVEMPGMIDAEVPGMLDTGMPGMPDTGMPDTGMPGMSDAGMPGMPDGSGYPMDADALDLDAFVAAPPQGGHNGTIPYDGGSGQNSWWADTDGVDPESAGCHVEYTAAGCATEVNPGRNFGEKCMSGDVLVETNPGPGECHQHAADIGHPYTVPCDAWCKNNYIIQTPGNPTRRGVAAVSGRCQTIGYLPCGSYTVVDSARCLCSDGYWGSGSTDTPGYPGP